MLKIAIVGAGFCGLAAAWHLVHLASTASRKLDITLFDSRGIGMGASGISAGLLHPFTGAHAKLNWRGKEGVLATKELIGVAEEALGKPAAAARGILRVALTPMQEDDFRRCASLHPDETNWLDADEVQRMAPGCAPAPALWIPGGVTVDSALYLAGLWRALMKREVRLVKQPISSLHELSSYDQILITAGAESKQIEGLPPLQMATIKGQVLELEWPERIPPLPCPLNSQVYLVMGEGNRTCLAGATYEKSFQTAESDQQTAEHEILPKAIALFPPLQGAAVISCSAGLRGAGPQHRPIAKQLAPGQWILTGMGSKGLLYHALFAKEIAQRMLAG
jgi:glycine/D-amino acid oxidase-like deaminating enzyme